MLASVLSLIIIRTFSWVWLMERLREEISKSLKMDLINILKALK